MERQAAKEERSRQDGPQGQVGVIMTSVGTEIFPGGSPALGGAGKQGALWNKPILPSGSWEGCIQEGTLHAWLEKKKDTLKDTSLAVHMKSCSSGTPGAATASEAESCAVQGGSASVVHCTDLLSCLSKKAPGTTGVSHQTAASSVVQAEAFNSPCRSIFRLSDCAIPPVEQLYGVSLIPHLQPSASPLV